MLSNVLVDVILGGIPLVGPLADIWFRANERNAALMRQFLASKPDDLTDLRSELYCAVEVFAGAAPPMSFQNIKALNTIACSPNVCQR